MREQFVTLLNSGEPRTVVLVTHDLEEAVILADRVVVLGEGGLMADLAMSANRTRDPDGLLTSTESLTMLRKLRSLLR